MNKKILLIIVSALIVAGLGLSIWYIFFRDSTTNNQQPTTQGGLPFGEGGGNIVPVINDPATGEAPGATNGSSNKLFQISDTPVAGFIAYSPRKDAPTIIRYVDRATGHIYDVNPLTLEKNKITNNTLPKIVEAYFKNDGSGVLLRSITDNDTVRNISLALVAPKTPSLDPLYTIVITELRGNLGSVWVSPTNLLVYSLIDDGSVSTSNFDGTKVTKLFSSAFTDWTVRSDNPANVVLVTKASFGVSGFAYSLDTRTGSLSKIIGPLSALTLLSSPDNKRFVYSYNSSGRTVFTVQTVATRETTNILPTTLAEKCVWSKKDFNLLYCGTPSGTIDAFEPDNWYKGITHFSDQIWSFDVDTKTAEILADPRNNSEFSIDTINPSLSPAEDYLVFMNKNDLSLWALKLR